MPLDEAGEVRRVRLVGLADVAVEWGERVVSSGVELTWRGCRLRGLRGRLSAVCSPAQGERPPR